MKRIVSKLKIHNRIRFGYGTAFFLLLLSFLFSLFTNNQLMVQSAWVDHTNKMITLLEKVLSDIKDGETGIRGFAIMKDERFLEPYYTSKSRVDTGYTILRNETKDDQLQQERLDTLRTLLGTKFTVFTDGITDLRNNSEVTDSLRILTFNGKQVMDRIRSLVGRMEIRETNILTQRKIEMQSRFKRLNAITIVSVSIASLMLIFAFLTYLRENKARTAADDKVKDYQNQLMKRIAELKIANKELVQMRSMEKFAATGRIARTIAHEVRNPLTNINLAIEQLATETGNTEADRGLLLDMVNRNSNRINHLITELLNSTKFTELNYEKTSINQLLDDALELAIDRIQLNAIKIVKHYGEGLCEVRVDKEKIVIAMLNLIVNAIEAMEPGKGILLLQTRADQGKCTVEITDNGTGIEEASISKLFEPYFTSKPKGNGLGLTNTQNIILNHNGTIYAESEKGKGTSFIISLDFSS